MTSKPHVTIISAEDGEWEGLYIDGKLLEEGHSIRVYDLLCRLGTQGIITWKTSEIPCEEDGSCPMPPTTNL